MNHRPDLPSVLQWWPRFDEPGELCHALGEFSQRFKLQGDSLVCAACRSKQRAEQAAEPFQHVEGCALQTDFARYPWRDLRAMLLDLPASS